MDHMPEWRQTYTWLRRDAADTPPSAQERAERRRDWFVWWTNGFLLLLVLGIFVIPALHTIDMRVGP